MTDAPSISRVRVRYAETDQMGIVYYANYFVWFEIGRTDLLRAAGWSYREMEAEGFALPVIEAQCVYREPARYDDEVEIRTRGASLSPVRVQFAYEVVRSADRVTLATGTTVHATLDRQGRPCRLPERVKSTLRPVLDTPERSARGAREREGASEAAGSPARGLCAPGCPSGGGAPRALKNAARASARGSLDVARREAAEQQRREWGPRRDEKTSGPTRK